MTLPGARASMAPLETADGEARIFLAGTLESDWEDMCEIGDDRIFMKMVNKSTNAYFVCTLKVCDVLG